MGLEKRKRQLDDGEAAGKRLKEPENVATVIPEPDDEEVEEFFAILRRMQVALKYFEKRNAESSRESSGAAQAAGRPVNLWKPAFRKEDFEETRPVGKVRKSRNAGLDLNSEPTSDLGEVIDSL